MIKLYDSIKLFSCAFLLSFLTTRVTNAQVFITEIADPNNNAGARYVELYNAGVSSFDFAANNYALLRYTNGNTGPQTAVALTGSIPAGGFYIISPNGTEFTNVYGLTADQDIGTGGPADSNGDDQILLIDNTDPLNPITIDIYGLIGSDGSGTPREFEDGRAERRKFVSSPNTTWTESEWNVDNDSGGGDGTQDAPGDFDPGAWIGPDVTAPSFLNSTPNLTAESENGFTINVELDDESTVYYVVLNDAVTAPVEAEVIAGTGNGGSAAEAFGSFTALENSMTAEVVNTLASSTSYDVYIVAEDLAGNSSGLQPKLDVTTTADQAPVVLSASTETANTSSTVTLVMSETVNTSGPIPSGFVINIDGSPNSATMVSGGGTNELVLTTSETIYKNNTVTVTYNQVDGDVADVTPNPLASFSDFSVANNTTLNFAADIAAARVFADGEDVFIEGEILVNHITGNSRDQIFIQDNNAGLLIDDNAPIITTVYDTGDGITGFMGTMGSFNGVKQIVPLMDPGAASSNGNAIVPVVVSIADFNSAIDTYESRQISIEGAYFSNADGVLTFTEPTTPANDYSELTDGVNSLFLDADGFIGSNIGGDVIPYGRLTVTGLAREDAGNSSAIITPINSADIVDNFEPQFTVAPAIINISSAGFDVTFQSDEPGTVYYVVNQMATPLTASEVLAGTSMAYTNVTGTDVTINITGLLGATEYYVHLLLEDDETSPNQMGDVDVVTVTATTGNNDADSDITANGGTTSNIDYASFQEATTLTDATSVSVFSFDINDKNTSDAVSTFLTAITFDVANFENLRTLALFDGTTNLAEAAVSAGSVEFTGLNIEAAAGGSKTINVRATFSDVVDDQDQIQLTVTNATADGAGSSFAAADAGGAASSIAASDLNAIEVTATLYNLTAPSSSQTATDFSVSATAVDANENTDIAARDVTLELASGAGVLSSVGGLGPVAMTDGVYTWNDVQHDTEEDILVRVTDGSVSSTSATISISNSLPQDIAANILISEVAVTPTEGEFIEIFNNTNDDISLDNYYLTDATFESGGVFYYNIVTGADYGGGDFADWHARFPAGSSIAAGEVQTIALNGSDNFLASYGIEPTYELYEDGASADAIPDMLEAVAGSINGQGGLTNGDEFVVLYYWDGASDLVTDVDYFHWGTSNEIVDKSGVAIDGPDGDATTSTYLNDTQLANQISVGDTHIDGNSWQRIDFDEGAEIAAGGNGVNGNDETSEDLNNTFLDQLADPGNVADPNALAEVTVAASLVDFGEIINGEVSTSQSFTVEGANLTGDITITAPDNFEVSEDNTTFATSITLTPVSEVVATTTIHVRFAPTTGINGVKSGDITIATDGAANQTIAVTGTETGNDAPDDDLFISEYIEGSSNNKALEIYNNSGAVADLSLYRIVRWNNGSTTASDTLELADISATLVAGGVLVIANPSADQAILDVADITSEITFFNGDDALRLYKNDAVLDEFGEVGVDPGSSWDVAGGSAVTGGGATAEFTLVRKPSISAGNPAPLGSFGTDPDNSEWLVLAQNDFSNIGFHSIDGVISPEITLTGTLNDFGNVNNGEVSSSQSVSIEGANLEADILVSAPNSFEVSLDDVTFSSEVTLTQNSGTVASTTIHVRFAPTTGINGVKDGSITASSTNALSQNINVSGTETGNSDITQISAIRPIDGNGEPTTLGNTVTIEGVLLGLNSRSTGFQIAINDGTGGVVLRETSGSVTSEVLSEGDEVRITGSVGFFNGTTQVDNITSVEVLSTGNERVNPIVITTLDESTEQELVQIDDVTIVDNTQWLGSSTYDGSGFNLDITFNGGSSTGTFRIEDDGDLHLMTYDEVFGTQTEGIILVGIGGQFDTSAPFTEGYQILVYQESDINPEEVVPGLTLITDNFNGAFGEVDAETSSASSSYTIQGAELAGAELTITIPEGFEASLVSGFDNPAVTGDSATPLSIQVNSGTIDNVEVFVRFSPAMAGEFGGDLVHATEGVDNQSVAVSGTGIEVTSTELSQFGISVYPNPVNELLTIDVNEGFGNGNVRLMSLSGRIIQDVILTETQTIDVSTVRAGVYVLQFSNANTVLNYRIVIE